MSAIDTAKEIVRIGSTAGLSKDVIDLLEKKATLLAEENIALKSQVAVLQAENAQLRQKLEHAQPQTKFVESEGLLWKRKPSGEFESRPYCPSCRDHPVMSAFPPEPHAMYSACPGPHTFDYAIKPPKT